MKKGIIQMAFRQFRNEGYDFDKSNILDRRIIEEIKKICDISDLDDDA